MDINKYNEVKAKMDDLFAKLNALNIEFAKTYKAFCDLEDPSENEYFDDEDSQDDFGEKYIEEVIVEMQDDFDVEDTHEIDFDRIFEELDRAIENEN